VDSQQFFGAARLVVVAGKGGVGKTTVTAAIARAAARGGRRVLAVDLEGRGQLAGLLVGSAVEVTTVMAAEALADYLDSHGFGRIARRLSATNVIDVVATAAPGIDDIVVLGKLKQLERSGTYDLIVVDGPAAGHAVTFLLAPRALLDAVRSGPVRQQAEAVLEMFADPARCQVVLVTLPERTPVNEVVETAYRIEEQVGIQLGPVVVNMVDDAAPVRVGAGVANAGGADLAGAAQFRMRRGERQAAELDRLGTELALAQLRLPRLARTALSPDDADRLADALTAAVEALSS
jgi:anion-transporting  ArsA/GET3 family ATPase